MKDIATFGEWGSRIRVYEQIVGGNRLVRVRWRQNGKRRTESWTYTAENKKKALAFAKGISEGREAPEEKKEITLRELWESFTETVFPTLRPKSQKLYREFWAPWELMWGKGFVVEKTTLPMANEFRIALTKQGKALSTIRHSIETVKMVYRWGQMHDYFQVNKLELYRFKIAKEQRVDPPAEYSGDEAERMIAQLDPNRADQWRAYVAVSICRYQGARQNAVLHLKWTDLTDKQVTWRKEWDKMGNEWTQPLRQPTKDALSIAWKWREKSGYEGEWVFPKATKKSKGDVYTIGALWQAIKKAETRADVARLPRRGGHGLRRLLAGDVARATKDGILAMRSIGDTDMKQAPKYLQKRDEDLEEAFSLLDKPEEEAKQ